MAVINIVIPVYNGIVHLHDTVDSILKQTFSDFEAFFIDDGSTDGSVEFLEKISKKDSRIRVFSKPHQGTVPHTWNYIFPMLSAPWTLYMSHDDILASDLLLNLYYKQRETNADAVIPTCHFFSKSFDDIEFAEKNRRNDMAQMAANGSITGHEAFELMLDYTIPGFALWRTSIIKDLGMPTESYNSDEGMQRLWVRACSRVAFSSAKFFYRLTPGSITRGLKPYHYASLLTNNRLLEAAREEKISSEKFRAYQYYCMSAFLYLKAQFISDSGNYSEYDINQIEALFSQVYTSYSEGITFPRSIKEVMLYLSAKSKLFLNLMVLLFSKKIS